MEFNTMMKALLRDALGVNELFTPRWGYYPDGKPKHLAIAEPGTQGSQEKWLIRRIDYDAQGRPEAILFADGKAGFNKAWDDRDTYDYL